jgi:DNA replication protein DnaC
MFEAFSAKMRLFFQVVAQRYERGSMILTSI